MKRRLPPALTPEALAEVVRAELKLIDQEVAKALSPDLSLEERRAAISYIGGHERRVGSMVLRSPEMIAEIEAERASTAREARHPHREERDPIINTALQANPTKPRKVLAEELNLILQAKGLPPV